MASGKRDAYNLTVATMPVYFLSTTAFAKVVPNT